MRMKKLLYLVPVVLLTACSSADVNLEQNQRLESLEEKVDALLVYNNKTYDILVDNELRISEVEKDAQKRGVPVPQKIVTVDSLKQLNTGNFVSPDVTAQQGQENLPMQEAQQVGQAQQTGSEVGALTGQDLTKVEEKTQQQVKENVVQPPKQTAEANKPVQKSAETKPAQPAKEAQPAEAAQAKSPVTEEPAQQAQTQTPQQVAAAASAENVAQVSEIATSSKQLYDNAYRLYQKHQYAESEMAFNAFLEQYPQDVLAPNALYWKGETLYARALYPQAIFAFKDVQTRYPKHPKTADSLLKTAMSYARLGDTENASLHYLVLLEDWPQSSAAQKARSMGAK